MQTIGVGDGRERGSMELVKWRLRKGSGREQMKANV